jgi:hypothetical protein
MILVNLEKVLELLEKKHIKGSDHSEFRRGYNVAILQIRQELKKEFDLDKHFLHDIKKHNVSRGV